MSWIWFLEVKEKKIVETKENTSHMLLYIAKIRG